MNNKENIDLNLINSENNKNNNYILLADKQVQQKYISKTEYPKFGYNSLKDINKESIEFMVNRDKNIDNNKNKVKYRFSKKINHSKNNNDLNIYKINDAINNINIKLDSTLNYKNK